MVILSRDFFKVLRIIEVPKRDQLSGFGSRCMPQRYSIRSVQDRIVGGGME
jgi:hypothetical protein